MNIYPEKNFDQSKKELAETEKYREVFIERDPRQAFSKAIDTLNQRIQYLGKIIHGIPAGFTDYTMVTGYEGSDLDLEGLTELKDFYGHGVELAADLFVEKGTIKEDEEELQNKVEAYINVTSAIFNEMIGIIPDEAHKGSLEYLENIIWDLEKTRDFLGQFQEKLPKPTMPKFSEN